MKPTRRLPPAPPPSDRPGLARLVTSVANPIVKEMRALQAKKEREESGLFLAEGLKLAADALDGGWRIRTLAYASRVKDQPMVVRVAREALARGALVLEVSEDVLEKISRRDNPQMVVAVVEQRILGLDDIDLDRSTVWVALEAVRDPGNLGTILRTIDSVGATGAILVGTVTDPFALEAVRATMGSIFQVPIAAATVDELIAWKRRLGVTMVGTHLKGAVDYRQPRYAEPLVLAMGNEQAGLTPELAAACDRLVKIPMAGRADSLNLAVATGVMLYEIRRPKLTV